MKQIHLTLLALLASIISLVAQQLPTRPNAYNADSLKTGDWVYYFDQNFEKTNQQDSIAYYRLLSYQKGKPVGTFRGFYANGQIQSTGTLLSEFPETLGGRTVWYGKTGIPQQASFYVDGKPDVQKTAELYRTIYDSLSLSNPDEEDYVTFLSRFGAALSRVRDINGAESVFKEGIEKAQEILEEDHVINGLLLFQLGGLYQRTGRLPEAEPLLLRALNIYKNLQGEDSPYSLFIMSSLGDVYKRLGRFDDSEAMLKNVIAIRKQSVGDEDPEYFQSLINLSNLYSYLRRISDLEPIYLQRLDIMERTVGTDHPRYAIELSNLGDTYTKLVRYQEAEKFTKQSLELFKKTVGSQSDDYAFALNNLGNLYTETQHFLEAEAVFRECLAIREEVYGEDHYLYRLTEGNLASLFLYMGRLQEAEALYLRGKDSELKILEAATKGSMERLSTSRDYSATLNNLAFIYKEIGQPEKAEQMYLESLKIVEEAFGMNDTRRATVLGNLANFYRYLGDYKKAEPLYLETLQLVKTLLGEEHPAYAGALVDLALLNQALGAKSDTIASYLNSALAVFTNTYSVDNNIVLSTEKRLARHYYLTNRKQEAIRIFAKVLDKNQEYIKKYFDVLGESQRDAFYSTFKGNFEEFMQLAFREAEANPELIAKACDLQLNQKALLLNTSNQIKQRILESGDRKLIDYYDEVRAIRQRLGQIESAPVESQDGLAKEKDSLSAILIEKDRQLTEYSTFYRKEKAEITWTAIRDQLGKKEALIEMVRFREYDYQTSRFTDQVRYGAFVITANTKNEPQIVFFPQGNVLEDRAIKAYQNFIKLKAEDKVSYAAFWEPLTSALKKIDKVYFSPDGVFNQVNMQTLFNADKGTYLFEEIDFQLITSGKELLAEKRDPLTNRYGLLIGNPAFGIEAIQENGSERGEELSNLLKDVERANALAPLPGAESEVKEISELLKKNQWRQQILTGEEAQEALLKDMLKPKVLHIATHGFFQENVTGEIGYKTNPLYRSGLLLSGAAKTLYGGDDVHANTANGKEDGILTAFEAMNLNIDNTDLVVLSACETGLGEIRNGEGVYGLQRAFKVAGARSILMSLWKVNDQTTQELMVRFYENWLGGQSKRAAFKTAQAAVKEKYPHPYYWGAFVMIGE